MTWLTIPLPHIAVFGKQGVQPRAGVRIGARHAAVADKFRRLPAFGGVQLRVPAHERGHEIPDEVLFARIGQADRIGKFAQPIERGALAVQPPERRRGGALRPAEGGRYRCA